MYLNGRAIFELWNIPTISASDTNDTTCLSTLHSTKIVLFKVGYKVLKHIVSSVVQAEIVGIFHNAKIALPIRHILEAIGHL